MSCLATSELPVFVTEKNRRALMAMYERMLS